MMKLRHLVFARAIAGTATAAPATDLPDDPGGMFGTWWRGGKGAAELTKHCPYIKGVFAAFKWSELEPKPGEYNWEYFDGTLKEYAAAGLYIQFMVWVGPDSPRWLYDHGVPEVKTTVTLNPHGKPHGWTYPFYLDEDYIRYYHRLIRAVAARIDTLPADVRKRIVCVQTAEGTTGDEGGYKGRPLDERYQLPREKWEAFKFETWRLFDELYRDKQPRIHLLINSGNQGQYHDWIMKNLPDTWRKAGNPGHGYQLNNEMKMIEFLDPIINQRNRNGAFIRCRSEMDEIFKGWFREAPVWNMYWLNLWGLHFGIDIFQHATVAFKNRDDDEGFEFYSTYGGCKDPDESPGAWCALRDGLDAADHQRFPDDRFGPGKRATHGAEMEASIKRCLAIAKAFKKYGARQGDPRKAMFTVMINRDASAMNDVGWDIWTGNYQRYLTQIDPNGTSRGWWRVGPKEQPYSRFARGFDAAAGKNAMYFDLDDRFFGQSPNAPHAISIRVVYYDKGKGSWVLKYDAVDDAGKTAVTVTNADSGQWREIVVSLDDARLDNGGPRQADLSLVRTAGDDTLFHLVELTRR